MTPAIMWSVAHAQGIKLPTRDYWEFRDMITVSPKRARSFDGYLQLFHWTELIQSSPIAVERAVYEVVGVVNMGLVKATKANLGAAWEQSLHKPLPDTVKAALQ